MTTVLEEESANNNNSYSRRKQISLYNSVISRLEKHGKFGETYSELVSNILDQVEGKEVNSEERSF
jgi:macrodomain Ter protein organizer (MatP/YcbG family)